MPRTPSPPGRAPHGPDRTVVCPGFGFDRCYTDYVRNYITEHAFHEKGLQRQIGVCTLVSNQERRALADPLINRGSTAGFVPLSIYIGFCLFVLAADVQNSCPRYLGGLDWRLAYGPLDTSASCSARPRRAPPPRRALRQPEPLVIRSGF